MAITLTTDALLNALRLGETPEETAEATRLLSFATQTISDYLGAEYTNAPEAVLNEAAIRLCGYLFDQPYATRGTFFSNALRNSGAGAMILPYRIHRAGSVSEATAAAQMAVGSSSNPVVNVEVSGSEMTITFADGETRTEALPSSDGGGPLADGEARQAAATAQARADSAWTLADGKVDESEVSALIESHATDADAHHTPPEGGGAHEVLSGGVYDGHLEGAPVAIRLGWNQSRTMSASIFTRANDHPIDGVAVGMTSGLAAPPFPPALASDPTLYLGLWLAGDPEIAALPSAFDASEKYVLSVGGVAGHYFASRERLPASTEGANIRAVIVGPRILTTADGGGASVVTRERLIFPSSGYSFQTEGMTGVTGGISTLAVAYPTDTDQDFWMGKMKTAFVAEDPDVASLVIGPMVEARSTTGGTMYTSDEKILLGFNDSDITLTIFGIELAANQRNSWFVWLVGV